MDGSAYKYLHFINILVFIIIYKFDFYLNIIPDYSICFMLSYWQMFNISFEKWGTDLNFMSASLMIYICVRTRVGNMHNISALVQ